MYVKSSALNISLGFKHENKSGTHTLTCGKSFVSAGNLQGTSGKEYVKQLGCVLYLWASTHS